VLDKVEGGEAEQPEDEAQDAEEVEPGV